MPRTLIRQAVTKLERVVHEGSVPYGKGVDTAGDAGELLVKLIGDEPQEVFLALGLNTRHRVQAVYEVSRGTLSSALVHPREVFGPALRIGVAAIIVGHNHPSGDPEPSSEDVELTRRLREAGELLGVPLLDHFVIGDGRWVALRDRMHWTS